MASKSKEVYDEDLEEAITTDKSFVYSQDLNKIYQEAAEIPEAEFEKLNFKDSPSDKILMTEYLNIPDVQQMLSDDIVRSAIKSGSSHTLFKVDKNFENLSVRDAVFKYVRLHYNYLIVIFSMRNNKNPTVNEFLHMSNSSFSDTEKLVFSSIVQDKERINTKDLKIFLTLMATRILFIEYQHYLKQNSETQE